MNGDSADMLVISEAKRRTAKQLMCAGLMPFWLGALAEVFWHGGADGLVSGFLMGYGAVIVAFIAGIHWGLYLLKDVPWNLFVHSNVVAVTAWVSLLLVPLMGYSLLLLCLLYLLALDYRLYQAAIIDRWFMTMRVLITSLVSFALLVAISAHAL